MASFDATFPEFVTSCGALYRALLPAAFVILLLAFVFEFYSGPPTVVSLLKFLLKLMFVVTLLANSHTIINEGQDVVQQFVNQNAPAKPENVAQRYWDQLQKAQSASGKDKKPWWKRILSTSSWVEASMFAALTLVSWLAMLLVSFVYTLQHVVLMFCWTVTPLLFPLLAVQPLSGLGTRHLLRICAVLLWPLGLALASNLTNGLISAAANQHFLIDQPGNSTLGYGLQNLLAVVVIAIWIVFSTVMAPVLIHMAIVGSPGSASLVVGAAASVLSAGAPLVASMGVGVVGSLGSPKASSTSPPVSSDDTNEPPFLPEFLMTPTPPDSDLLPPEETAGALWQPAADDPTGDKAANALVEKITKS